MATEPISHGARVGDLIEARGLYGQPARRGEIVELIGGAQHRRYRVRWDEQHESIVYPADGVLIIPRRARTERVTGGEVVSKLERSKRSPP